MRNRKLWVSVLAAVLALVMLLSLVASIIPTLVNADDWDDKSSSEMKDIIKELEAEKGQIQDQIDALQDRLDANMSEMERIVAEKDIVDQEIALMHQQIEKVNQQLNAYNLLIADKQEELDEALAHQEVLRQKNKARIRAMEERGSINYWSVLFQANSFSDLLDRVNMVDEIAASDQRRLNEMRDAAEVVAQAQEALEAQRQELVAVREELNQTQVVLESKRAESDALLVELNAMGEAYEQEILAGEDELELLLGEIAKAEDAYDEAKDREYQQWLSTSKVTTKPTTKPGTSDSTPPPANPGGWVRPVKGGTLTSPYGWRVHPVYGTWKFHSGVDIGIAKGTPIYASRSGTVTTATYSSSAGNYVTINHGDGFSTSYLHMTHYIVSKGQTVSAGQVIGYVGSTGVSTGPHLHFTIYYKGETVNPCDYLNLY